MKKKKEGGKKIEFSFNRMLATPKIELLQKLWRGGGGHLKVWSTNQHIEFGPLVWAVEHYNGSFFNQSHNFLIMYESKITTNVDEGLLSRF